MNMIEIDDVWGMPIGVTVITADGDYLGAVTEADDDEFLVEDGSLRHCTYAFNVFDVDRFEGGRLHLKLTTVEAVDGRCVG